MKPSSMYLSEEKEEMENPILILKEYTDRP